MLVSMGERKPEDPEKNPSSKDENYNKLMMPEIRFEPGPHCHYCYLVRMSCDRVPLAGAIKDNLRVFAGKKPAKQHQFLSRETRRLNAC